MNKGKKIIVVMVMLLSIIGITVGITYATFTYVKFGTTENTMTTGSISFVYDEKEAAGNGITLTNAMPKSDRDGKILIGNKQVFDFQIAANTVGTPMVYEVLGEKQGGSTLDESVVKIYLTTISGDTETSTPLTEKNGKVLTYNQLTDTTLNKQTGKTLYQEAIALNTVYSKNFRLRMWISEDAASIDGVWNYSNKVFSLKINITANGENSEIPQYADKTGASIPEPLEGMIPVTYNGTDWVKADTTAKWYDYQTQMWANAVTVTETNRNSLMNANPGTVIPMSDINTMWVWIPKYEYKVDGQFGKGGTSVDLPGEIEVNFKNKTDITPTPGYTLHPAFNFGGENLSGIWVGKFETTGTINSPTIKPNETSFRNKVVSAFFNAGRAMQNAGNPYGFSNIKGDIHMIKNIEWGAATYLTQSKYGKYGNPNYTGANKEVYQNKSSEFITGSSNGTPPSGVTNAQVTYNVENTGTGASTTGTIYGVYDMSGGSWEYTMGVLADPSGNPRSGNNPTYNSGFKGMYTDGIINTTGQDFPNNRYYNLYTGTTGLKGDATNADGTQGWYGDYAGFVSVIYPWVLRGGSYLDDKLVGTFCYSFGSGDRYDYSSSRVVAKP